MNSINKITSWGDSHHAGWMDIFRVVLGGYLFYKGVIFGKHPQEIYELINESSLSLFSFFLIQCIPLVHLAGGLMIAIGLQTRWAIIFQIPIVAGAILLHLFSATPLDIYAALIPTVIVFAGLMIFLMFGSGTYSADKYFEEN